MNGEIKKCCNAILYLGQFSEPAQTQHAKNLLDQCKGVVNTMLGQASPKLLLVDYDPGEAKILDFINVLKTQGISAKIIGL